MTCEPIVCSANCDYCSSNDVCDTCAPGYFLDDDMTCEPVICMDNCDACTYADLCDSCASGYNFDNNVSCELDAYTGDCMTDCDTCTDLWTCT